MEIAKVKINGNCFEENALKFVECVKKNKSELVDYYLVHGIVINSIDKKPMQHCWIEQVFSLGSVTQTTCLDYSGSHAHKLSKESYYAIGGIKENNVVRYDYAEATKNMLDSNHYGSWDKKFNGIR
jgi:hypothetical protein